MKTTLAALALTALTATAANAASCQIVIYFNEPELTNQVGTWSSCPGMKGQTGRRTPYKIVSTETLPSRPKPPGIACEFKPKGCKVFEPRAGLSFK